MASRIFEFRIIIKFEGPSAKENMEPVVKILLICNSDGTGEARGLSKCGRNPASPPDKGEIKHMTTFIPSPPDRTALDSKGCVWRHRAISFR